jgi:hypothetical protein
MEGGIKVFAVDSVHNVQEAACTFGPVVLTLASAPSQLYTNWAWAVGHSFAIGIKDGLTGRIAINERRREGPVTRSAGGVKIGKYTINRLKATNTK